MKRTLLVLGGFCALVKMALADPLPGDRWSPAALSTIDGERIQWKPKRLTVVSFYAFWCDTWRVQEPALEASKKQLGHLPVDFLTVSVDGRWRDVVRGKANLPLFVDPGGEWSHAINVDHVPTTVVLAEDGTVRWARSGTLSAADVSHAVRDELAGGRKPGPIYLTIDGFPGRTQGSELLDALQAANVHATLFCDASRMTDEPDLFKRAETDGNELECEGWSGNAGKSDLSQSQAAFRSTLGHGFSLVRPREAHRINGVLLDNYDPYDASRPGKTELIRRVLFAIRSNQMLELHAGVSETVEALPELVDRLRKLGYRFERLDQRKRPMSN